eukprot:scaffold20548_cov223-Amphora_coffeaeformis.AAC.5
MPTRKEQVKNKSSYSIDTSEVLHGGMALDQSHKAEFPHVSSSIATARRTIALVERQSITSVHLYTMTISYMPREEACKGIILYEVVVS